MKKLATASLIIIILIAGCSTSSNDNQNVSQSGISITATQPTAWEGSGSYIEFVIDIGTLNETAGNIIVYFDATGTALDRDDLESSPRLQNGYVEITPGSQTAAISIEGFMSDGIITETQTITLRITGCSSEYPIGPLSEATAVVRDSDGPTVTDVDGNLYHSVLIGLQTWLVENLKTSRYRNGDTVMECWFYNNDPSYGITFGMLYDWHAVSDPRGLAPAGWHIPSDAEWTQLTNYLGNEAGKKMKSPYCWNYDGNGTNESGFTAFPGGHCSSNGIFDGIGTYGFFWSSSEDKEEWFGAWGRNLSYGASYARRVSQGLYEGFSVRGVKD
jgi:uncharacterized protein (TIGR02145 family)